MKMTRRKIDIFISNAITILSSKATYFLQIKNNGKIASKLHLCITVLSLGRAHLVRIYNRNRNQLQLLHVIYMTPSKL